MRAALIDKPFSLVVTQMEEPEIQHPDQVKIKIRLAGICGSELHAYRGTHPFRIPPVVSGHELAGQVVEVGGAVTACKAGDRVTVEPHYGCGACADCQAGRYNVCRNKRVLGAGEWTGSFAEYIVVPQRTVVLLPDDMEDTLGALIEPLAVSMHAVRTAGITIGDTVAVIGCGPIGLAAVLCARLAGASRLLVSDAQDWNLELAAELGATLCVNPRRDDFRTRVAEFTGGNGVDCTILAFGNRQVYDDALHITRRGGTVSQVALMGEPIPIDIALVQQKEIRAIGSNMYTRADFLLVRDALGTGRMTGAERMITEILPIEDAPRAFQTIDKRLRPVIKVLLRF